MGMTSLTRENWRDRVRFSGLTLIELAARTGKSFSAVYAYSRGARQPSDAWIDSVAAVLHDYANEWTCMSCGTRNIRATSHGSAQ